MTLLTLQVTPGVWVARGERGQWARPDPHPHDRAAAAVLPRWRVEEFLASRALLRHLLRTTLPELADEPVLAEEQGRPVLAGAPGTGISISHDGDAVAVAVARSRRVGVDVQQPPDSVPDALLRRCLGTHTPQVATLPQRTRAAEFAWVWTAQEACVKAAGTGLSGRPWAIDIQPGRRRGQWHEFQWISLRDRSRTPLSCAFSAPRHDLDTS
ncbi:4'-phosphopantetheinyl transferase superfamily protein [Streptomyces sp. ID05-04B]|uniref:4'-phosphopantetheinyl transferase family protein n=1 Tax=unclassified Streptomyces TaxID=2593676 RepID=UPI001C1F539A|nr:MULTISPECIES: 4'-phosphopantetheinyl transferase superfamily protein [unclassified Streptomyces]MDX5569330.1 4'-phosphopantetheinyl transferase superfamily protein [Streptomyces sp. ID05-04B]